MVTDIYLNGTILTMHPDTPEVEALATAGDRIVAVGSRQEITELRGPGTRVVDLNGACLLPGFHDAHLHLTGFGLELGQLDLDAAGNVAEALELVRNFEPAGEWLLGSGFSLARWGVTRLEATELDAVSRGRPVALRSQDHHSAWLNSRALELLGITADTPDPEGGLIQRDDTGNPSGLLFEAASAQALWSMPAPGEQRLQEALRAAGDYLASLGVTTVHHMASERPGYWRQLALASSDRDYPIRVWACIDQENIEAADSVGVATGQGGDNFIIGGAKFFIDGALGSRTAWMIEPYEGTDDAGIAMLSPEVVTERTELAIDGGLVPVFHAIGDRAVQVMLDACEATRPLWEPRGMRPRLEHAQHMTPADITRMAAMGVIASVQPIHLTFDAPGIPALLGARGRQAYAFRQMIAAGARLAFGSDAPVAPASVRAGLVAATTRRDMHGAVFHPEEAVTTPEALEAYTHGAAYAIGRENRSGRLAPGFDADLVLVSVDPRRDLEGMEVLRTIKAGRETFDAGVLE